MSFYIWDMSMKVKIYITHEGLDWVAILLAVSHGAVLKRTVLRWTSPPVSLTHQAVASIANVLARLTPRYRSTIVVEIVTKHPYILDVYYKLQKRPCPSLSLAKYHDYCALVASVPFLRFLLLDAGRFDQTLSELHALMKGGVTSCV